MKLSRLLVMAITGLSVVSCGKEKSGNSSSSALKTEMDSISYSLGMSSSEQIKNLVEGIDKDFGLKLNLPAYHEGYNNGIDSTNFKFDVDKSRDLLTRFFQEQRDLSDERAKTKAKAVALPISADASIKTVMDSVSYALGVKNGYSVTYMTKSIKKDLGLDVNVAAYKAGYKKGGDSLAISKSRAKLDAFFKKKQEEVDKVAKEVGDKFLAENKKKEGVKTTESGLQYIVLKEGTGKTPTADSTVKVHYHGTLIDGTVFDSSVQRNEPAEFGVGQVIKGWTEGLQLMKVGSKYKFFIPQDLAYGARSAGALIKPFSALIFEVELLEVKKGENSENSQENKTEEVKKSEDKKAEQTQNKEDKPEDKKTEAQKQEVKK